VSLYLAVGCLVLFHVTGWNQGVLTGGDGLLYQLHNTATMLGRCTVPVAMIIGGARIATLTAHEIRHGMAWFTTLLRLIVVPLIAVFLLQFVPLNTFDKNIMIVVAVMPAAIASLMLSEIFGGDKQLIAGSVLLTHLFSILTVPVLLYFLLAAP
jgi:predicted permease